MSARDPGLEDQLAQIRRRLAAIEAELAALRGDAQASDGGAPPAEQPSALAQGLSLGGSAGPGGGLSLGESGRTPGEKLAAEPAGGELSLETPAAGAQLSAEPALTLGETEPASATPATNENARLIGRLAEVRTAIQQGLGSVAAKDAGFLDKAAHILAQKGPDVLAGNLGENIILDCVKKQFTGLAKYNFPAYDELRRVVDDVEGDFLQYVEKKMNLRFFPLPGETAAEAKTRLPEAAENIAEKLTPSLRPNGALVGVLRRGVIAPNGSVQKAQIAVSAGAEDEVVRTILLAGDALAKAPQGGEAVAEVQKALANLAGGGKENVLLRDVLNECWKVNTDKSLSRVIERLQSILQNKHGWHMLRVTVGEMFGEKHSPSKFERKRLSSDQSPGMIVSVVRPGFIDKNGIPVQKAVLGVSADK